MATAEVGYGEAVSSCAICEKHKGKGPLVGAVVYEDETVLVSHAPAGMADG
jgi:hypothetical protein